MAKIAQMAEEKNEKKAINPVLKEIAGTRGFSSSPSMQNRVGIKTAR